MSEEPTQSVLLVEADAALRRVMAVGLRQQGVEVLEAASPRQAQPLLERNPSLLIVDIDSGLTQDWSLLNAFRADSTLAQKPVVVLAWDCSPEIQNQIDQADATVCLAKPFDARRLLSEVETLLAATPQPVEAAALASVSIGQTDQALHAASLAWAATLSADAAQENAQYPFVENPEATPTPAPSLWPILLALGLALAVSGLLVHVVLVVLGVLVAFGALLLWGFEPTARPGEA